MWDAIKKLIVQFIMKYVVSALVPMLGGPILGPIAAFFLGKLVDIFGNEVALMIAYKKIDKSTDSQVKAVEDAALPLQEELSKPKEQRDAQKLLELRKKLKDAARELIVYKPSK